MIGKDHRRLLRMSGAIALASALVLVPALFQDFRVYQLSVALTYAIAILGLNLLMGFNGQISVAHGVFFAIGAYTSAILMSRYGVDYLATLPVATATATLLGLAGSSGAAMAGSAAYLHYLRPCRARAPLSPEARAHHQGSDRHQHRQTNRAHLVPRQSGHVPVPALSARLRAVRPGRTPLLREIPDERCGRCATTH